MTAALRRLAAAAMVLLGVADGYLMLLLVAATAARRRNTDLPPLPSPRSRRFLVLVPAHDEEPVIARTVAALVRLEYPEERRTIVVVADNCTDRTAEVAAQAGAVVWERHDPQARGKGHALAWALGRAGRELEYDAVAMVDADCIASPNLLDVAAAQLDAGHDAVQTDYAVARPERAWAVALRYAAFALMNTLRPMGKTRLGLSSGLLGTGMAFRRDVLEAVPWRAFSIVEDAEYHAHLVAAGRKAVFDPRARVSSEMPASLAGSRDQQMRWEGGRGVVIRQTTLPLLLAAVRRRDPVRLNAAVEWLVPPQSLLLVGHAVVGTVAAASRARAVARICAALLALQGVFVLGGLLVVRAPIVVFRALLFAPALVVQKLAIYGRLAAGRTPRSFVRTARD